MVLQENIHFRWLYNSDLNCKKVILINGQKGQNKQNKNIQNAIITKFFFFTSPHLIIKLYTWLYYNANEALHYNCQIHVPFISVSSPKALWQYSYKLLNLRKYCSLYYKMQRYTVHETFYQNCENYGPLNQGIRT